MNSNRICILTAEFPPQPGGIGNHAYNLAQGLADNGYDVTVISDQRSKSGKEERLFDISLNFGVVRIPRKSWMMISYIHRILVAFKITGKSNVLIASGKFPLWIGAFISFFNNKKYIAVVHGSELLLPKKVLRELTNVSLRRYGQVIAVSHFTSSLLRPHFMNKVHVVHNGFRLKCTPKEEKKSLVDPILITVGNVTQRKGQQNVIKALPLLLKKYPGLQYHMVGIPTEKEKLETLASQLKVEKAIVFHGAVSEAEKCSLLGKADIFIMLSENTSKGDVEGFGIALLEANSLGLPSIGANSCGIEDAIKGGYSGCLVNSTSSDEVLVAMEKIIQFYQEFSDNSKKWSANFEWDQVIEKYIQLIEK